MKKSVIVAAGLLALFAFSAAGCGEEKKEEEIFSNDLVPLDEEALEEIEEGEQGDEEFSVVEDLDGEVLPGDEEQIEGQKDENADGDKAVAEEQTYTEKGDVARYLHEFGHLPSNYITKEEARKLGWKDGKNNLAEVAPGKVIGGDEFSNMDKMLPEEEGRIFYECEVNVKAGERGKERLIYTNDGLIFYTGDNMETFEQVY